MFISSPALWTMKCFDNAFLILEYLVDYIFVDMRL